ncbi:MAG: hypothetical protein OER90_15685 [Gemmatimonadota bacterium]|nr:hypothetical protein [Gemmatimonadota bacterium]
MSPKIRLQCSDSELGKYVSTWLDEIRLDLPITLDLRLTIVDSAFIPEDNRVPFRQPRVEIRSGPPLRSVGVLWLMGAAHAVIEAKSTEARVSLTTEAAARREELVSTFLHTVLVLLVRRAGWHHLHAATAQDSRGRGWLVAGDARAGKSTMAALLASRGWPVGTDDTAFLARRGEHVVVHAARGRIALRHGGYMLLSQNVGARHERRGKMLCFPEELGAAWLPSVKPDVLLFTRVGDRRSNATAITSREALAELVRWSAWVALEADLAQDHLNLLRDLATQAQGYRVTLGRDLFDDPMRLEELIP